MNPFTILAVMALGVVMINTLAMVTGVSVITIIGVSFVGIMLIGATA